nr:hypothetical protein Iba_scaffold954086CG0010 [Ipomoea batatas]GMD00694.1 hypothetical protein Iba_scaffold954087CG0010 [Ipomoea batatas]GMD70971.1 hypothetical protein Iba_chr12eCG11480 [Ipomoea batatas]
MPMLKTSVGHMCPFLWKDLRGRRSGCLYRLLLMERFLVIAQEHSMLRWKTGGKLLIFSPSILVMGQVLFIKTCLIQMLLNPLLGTTVMRQLLRNLISSQFGNSNLSML